MTSPIRRWPAKSVTGGLISPRPSTGRPSNPSGCSAPRKTLRALEPYLPKASVRVITRLDRTIVLVDGKQYGITDTTGILQINDLEPGEHLIETRNRPRYKDGQLRVVLRPRDNQEVVFEPEVNVGTLTITPLTPNLEVTVYNELASLTGTFAKRELAPGIYTLQARSRWHQPITQIIQIKAGQHLTLPVELELDEALLETTVVEAQKAFSSKDYTRSVNILLEVLNITPRNLPALNLLAQNYLRLNDTPNFTATAKRILDADGTLDFALLLHTEKKGRSRSASSSPVRPSPLNGLMAARPRPSRWKTSPGPSSGAMSRARFSSSWPAHAPQSASRTSSFPWPTPMTPATKIASHNSPSVTKSICSGI